MEPLLFDHGELVDTNSSELSKKIDWRDGYWRLSSLTDGTSSPGLEYIVVVRFTYFVVCG